MQQALIVNNDAQELNEFLIDGWKVVHTCGMPSSASIATTGEHGHTDRISIVPTCLVIIEK